MDYKQYKYNDPVLYRDVDTAELAYIYGGRMNEKKKLTKKTSKKERPSNSGHRLSYLDEIVVNGRMFGNISVFAHQKSPVSGKYNTLGRHNISAYFNDPIEPWKHEPTCLLAYDFSVIVDALEYIPGKMAKANLLKESLCTLKSGSSKPHVTILAKTRKAVKRVAKSNKYEELENGFFIPDGPFKGLTIQGLDAEDIWELAYFAGAKYMKEDTVSDKDLICVRVSLRKQV